MTLRNAADQVVMPAGSNGNTRRAMVFAPRQTPERRATRRRPLRMRLAGTGECTTCHDVRKSRGGHAGGGRAEGSGRRSRSRVRRAGARRRRGSLPHQANFVHLIVTIPKQSNLRLASDGITCGRHRGGKYSFRAGLQHQVAGAAARNVPCRRDRAAPETDPGARPDPCSVDRHEQQGERNGGRDGAEFSSKIHG